MCANEKSKASRGKEKKMLSRCIVSYLIDNQAIVLQRVGSSYRGRGEGGHKLCERAREMGEQRIEKAGVPQKLQKRVDQETNDRPKPERDLLKRRPTAGRVFSHKAQINQSIITQHKVDYGRKEWTRGMSILTRLVCVGGGCKVRGKTQTQKTALAHTRHEIEGGTQQR